MMLTVMMSKIQDLLLKESLLPSGNTSILRKKIGIMLTFKQLLNNNN